MTYTFAVKGTCSREMTVELDENNVIGQLQVVGGCNGNLKGMASLVRGMKAEEAIARLRGIECGSKGTSCPDQFAQGLERILAEQAAK